MSCFVFQLFRPSVIVQQTQPCPSLAFGVSRLGRGCGVGARQVRRHGSVVLVVGAGAGRRDPGQVRELQADAPRALLDHFLVAQRRVVVQQEFLFERHSNTSPAVRVAVRRARASPAQLQGALRSRGARAQPNCVQGASNCVQGVREPSPNAFKFKGHCVQGAFGPSPTVFKFKGHFVHWGVRAG